jgi:hypothetical protein
MIVMQKYVTSKLTAAYPKSSTNRTICFHPNIIKRFMLTYWYWGTVMNMNVTTVIHNSLPPLHPLYTTAVLHYMVEVVDDSGYPPV